MSENFSEAPKPYKHWRGMDVPPRVVSCLKLRKGQLLMQRYQYVWEQHRDTRYHYLAEKCKDKSVRLAGLMVKHVEGCNVCQKERVLEEVFFYGVYKRD
jgi:hypothetical protein